MGYQSGAGKRDDTGSNDNGIDQRRSKPREEAPWLKDQRRAPRSVRTPPPYNTNMNDVNRGNNNWQKLMRRQRQLPRKRHTNPFESPQPSSSGSTSTATPISRNPSPSNDNRMLYTGSPQPERVNLFGPSPSQRTTSTNQTYTMYNPTTNNPFDSPAAIRNVATGKNPFDSSSPIKRNTGTNPFESPASIPQQQQNNSKQRYNKSPKTTINPFENSIIDDSPSYPKVRVTVHTQHSDSLTPNKQSQHKQHDSVALDSLEQILDTTEETEDEEESDDVVEDAGGNEGWSDEPYRKEQQQEPQLEGYHQQFRQHHRLNTPASTYFASRSRQNNTISNSSLTSGSEDGTNTTASPSEKALRAAQTLKESFEQRRREKASGFETVETIDEDEGQLQEQHHNDLVLEYSRAEDELVPLGGVAGKRRAEAEAKNAVVADNNKVTTAVFTGNPNRSLQQPESKVPQKHNKEELAEAEKDGAHEQHQHQNERTINDNSIDDNYTLHDLCDEAIDTDDLAWRNALYLLSVQPHLAHKVEPECDMTPLHVACLAQQPPPVWIIRGLLYAAPETCSQPDSGGRLPLHLLVATSAHIDSIRLLVEEYPPGVAHRDDRGFTPLQLLLKRNDSKGLILEHLRLLLGQRIDGLQSKNNRKSRMSFRLGDHLKSDWVLEELESLAEKREQKHESAFREYPDDVRRALTKLSQWKRRQSNKQSIKMTRSDQEKSFLRLREADFVSPASISTPIGQLLPLHLLVRRNIFGDGAISHDIKSVKTATLLDLLRVLIAAYPQGLVCVDANGKTPVMTVMLQSDVSPSEDVIELLLGLRTPGFDGRNVIERPACIATGDTLQLPLHVAAEELLSKHSLLCTICEAYPDARTIQDVRGRTPIHLALQNYRSTPVDEATLELLFVDPVAKVKDNDGKTPLDLLLENPGCVIRRTSQMRSSTIFQEFFNASIERPQNRLEAEAFLRKFQRFPPWLRSEACAARFVQDILVEEIATPFATFRILGSGIVLALLLLALRRTLHVDPEYTFLIYYLATYHLVIQMINWGIAIYLGQFFRMCLANIWRWIDLSTVVLSTWCAIFVSRNISDINDVTGTILLPVGASATLFCWLSLLGYFVEWSCGLAVFVGSAVQLFLVLAWPLCIAVMGFFAVSQVLFTLEECTNRGMCTVSESYELVYLTIIGRPVLIDEDYELSTEIFLIILLFSILCLWWTVSVIAMIVAEAGRLDRRQLSLAWYWEPKVALTVLTLGGSKDAKISESSSLAQQYCDTSEKFWHIFASALCGEKSDVHWDAFPFRSTPMMIFTGFAALFILPIWLVLGLVTLGLLWPPQIRRWLFCPRPASSSKLRDSRYIRPFACHEGDLSNVKLSKLRADLTELKAVMQDQNHRLQKDLGSIKDVIFRAVMEDEN